MQARSEMEAVLSGQDARSAATDSGKKSYAPDPKPVKAAKKKGKRGK